MVRSDGWHSGRGLGIPAQDDVYLRKSLASVGDVNAEQFARRLAP
jgi:hypothetical protein